MNTEVTRYETELCPCGWIKVHQNDQKRWHECSCGKHQSRGIDLSSQIAVKAAKEQFEAMFTKPAAEASSDEKKPEASQADRQKTAQRRDAPADGKDRKGRQGSKG